VVHASCEPHPCAMEPRMNGAPMMSLVRETKLWVGHPPESRALTMRGEGGGGPCVLRTPPMRDEAAHEWGTPDVADSRD
jgi:hypothetical protein